MAKINRRLLLRIGALLCTLCVLFSLFSCTQTKPTDTSTDTSAHTQKAPTDSEADSTQGTGSDKAFALTPTGLKIPEYSGDPFVILLNNEPLFTSDDWVTRSFETYEALDSLSRCTVVSACIGRDLMPTEERGSIGSVKPSGWQTVKYDFVDGKYLYNRCHLIGWQLTGENANVKNLITGTRYLNIEGMLPFENMVADYVKETNNHVLYRVTPIFEGNELVARGVVIEGWSVEDHGEGICFHVFAYNVQPGVEIDYKDGTSREVKADESDSKTEARMTYVLNTSSKKFHLEGCSSVGTISQSNKKTYTGTRDELILDGYSPCGSCKP